MPDTPVYDSQPSFTGLNTASDPVHLQPGEFTAAINAKLTLYGGVTPRLGTQRISTTPFMGGVQAMYFWQQPAGQTQLLVVAGGLLYTAPLTGPPPWTFTNQGNASGAGQPSMVAFTDANNVPCVYVGNITGTTGLLKWNGTTLTTLPITTAACSILAVQNQRLVGVKNEGPSNAFAQSIFWSSLNNGDDLGFQSVPGAGGNSVVLTFGESYLRGLQPFQAGTIIGHVEGLSIFQGFGQTDMSIQTGTYGLSADTGIVNGHGIVAVESFAIVASDRGAYVVTPFGFLEQISREIDNLWSVYVPPVGYPEPGYPQGPAIGWMVHDRLAHSVYIVGSGTTSGTPILCYNYRLGKWSGPWVYSWSVAQVVNLVTTGPYITSLAAGFDQQNTGLSYILAGCSDGVIRRLEVPGLGLDDVLADGTGGSPYTMQVQTKVMPGQSQGGPLWWTEKAWDTVYVQAQLRNPLSMGVKIGTWPTQGAVSFQPQTIPGIINNQPDTGPRPYRIKVGARGNYIAVVISDTPVNNPAGQNTYYAVRVRGQDLGERYSP